LQESGRAGRDGNLSRAIFLWGPDDERSLTRAKTEGDQIRIAKLLSYTRDTGHCRREALLDLLDYDGEKDSPGFYCCDVCEKEAHPGLREEASIINFFHRNKRSYTINEAAKILAKAENIRWPEESARETISYLLKTGQLKKQKNPLWRDKITVN
jgi:ATP-dependent DNA helicase RecQ